MFLFRIACPPLGTNAILLACEETKKAAVVDPGSGAAVTLLRKAEAQGFHIEKILLTHSHWDHIADLAALKEATQAAVYVHKLDAANVQHPGSDQVPSMLAVRSATPDVLMEDGQVIRVGNVRLEVMHTPGHARGAVCFYLPDEHMLLSGDTLFRGGIGNLSLTTSEPEKMRASLHRLAALPPHTRVIPGHGGETTIERENLGEY